MPPYIRQMYLTGLFTRAAVRGLEDDNAFLKGALDESEQHRSSLIAQMAAMHAPTPHGNDTDSTSFADTMHFADTRGAGAAGDADQATHAFGAESTKMNADLDKLETAERLIRQLRAELDRLRAGGCAASMSLRVSCVCADKSSRFAGRGKQQAGLAR